MQNRRISSFRSCVGILLGLAPALWLKAQPSSPPPDSLPDLTGRIVRVETAENRPTVIWVSLDQAGLPDTPRFGPSPIRVAIGPAADVVRTSAQGLFERSEVREHELVQIWFSQPFRPTEPPQVMARYLLLLGREVPVLGSDSFADFHFGSVQYRKGLWLVFQRKGGVPPVDETVFFFIDGKIERDNKVVSELTDEAYTELARAVLAAGLEVIGSDHLLSPPPLPVLLSVTWFRGARTKSRVVAIEGRELTPGFDRLLELLRKEVQGSRGPTGSPNAFPGGPSR